VLKATGRHFSPHGCRHTFATRAIERTGKLKAVSEYLGHASVSITLDMYVHEEIADDELRGLSINV
jgi:integrase